MWELYRHIIITTQRRSVSWTLKTIMVLFVVVFSALAYPVIESNTIIGGLFTGFYVMVGLGAYLSPDSIKLTTLSLCGLLFYDGAMLCFYEPIIVEARANNNAMMIALYVACVCIIILRSIYHLLILMHLPIQYGEDKTCAVVLELYERKTEEEKELFRQRTVQRLRELKDNPYQYSVVYNNLPRIMDYYYHCYYWTEAEIKDFHDEMLSLDIDYHCYHSLQGVLLYDMAPLVPEKEFSRILELAEKLSE